MKLPYHEFTDDTQADGMHTFRQVVTCIVHWLSQQKVKISKEKIIESERKIRSATTEEELLDILYT